jgi:hypothetical protein
MRWHHSATSSPRAEDLYAPSGPPISPLTTSYFTCWAFFDACVGPTNETIGTTVLELGAAFGMHAELLRLIRLMHESRMGLYVHEGAENGLVALRDVVTGAVCDAISPAGYRGRRASCGMPGCSRRQSPAAPNTSSSRCRTLCCSRGCDWQAYFRRTLPEAPPQARLDAYARHMKYGPTRMYWNDLVFEAYVNHRTEVTISPAFPTSDSRPHSEVHGWGFGR